MDTKRVITVEDSKNFFNTSINSIEDAIGIAFLSLDTKQVTFDYTSVFLLRFTEILAEAHYDYNSSLFDDDLIKIFEQLFIQVIEDNTEFEYVRKINEQEFHFSIKIEKTEKKQLKLYFICYEKLLETEQQLKLFSNVVGSGMNMFSGSTWWIDYDRYNDHFYQSDTGPKILGMKIDDKMLYDTKEFQKVRENARKVSPFYDESIAEEKKAFELLRDNKEDYFGARTPAVTLTGEVIWVEAYGKCLIRYPDGRQRFMVAIDIYLSDVFENSHQLEILNNLVDTGLINSNVGVWYYQSHLSVGRYYFTKSHRILMGIQFDYNNENISEALDFHFAAITKHTQEYEPFLKNFREIHNKMFTEGLDKYQIIVPNHLDKNNPQWIEIRGTVIERDKNGEILLFVGVNVDVTQSYLRNQELERLRVQNERLQLAEKLGIKAGNVLVWYQDESLIKNRKYIFGNDMFTQKLGIPRTKDGLLKLYALAKTLLRNDELSSAMNHKLMQGLDELYSGKNRSFKRSLAKHINLSTGDIYYFEHNVEVEEYNEDGSIKLLGGFMLDVTENILKQEQITYLANFDVLSGIHNRNYFDHFINEGLLPDSYSIILFDVDGLKLTNDAFGHIQGDKIIKQLATFLSDVFTNKILVARIGGDEFLVLTKDTNINRVTSCINKLEKTIIKFNKTSHIEVNVSKGVQVVVDNDISFENAFTQAENLMYRRKLNNRSSRKFKVLESILETLNAKTEETNDHSERLRLLATQTLQALGMNRTSEIEDIELLARVHDIGKITVPDHILTKPGTLTETEYEHIKKHSEAGYKIIQNITDSDNVGKGVLSHHEHYDGSGYPQGLKGYEISIYARIIAVADAYDAITSDRVYQKRRTHKEAVAEIRRCSGTQFDPKVVSVFLKGCFNE